MKYEVLTECGESVDIVNAKTERGLNRSLKNLMESMYESTVLAICSSCPIFMSDVFSKE